MAEPSAQALLTCDAVARDPNGKVTLYGVFDRIFAQRFPVVHPMFAVYWRCSVPGPGRAGVKILRPDSSLLAELEPVESSGETPHTMQGTYTLGAFEFPVPGDYMLVLVYNGRDLMRATLHLEEQKVTVR